MPMGFGVLKTRVSVRVRPRAAADCNAALASRRAAPRAKAKGDGTMQREARSRRIEVIRARPLAELLECPLDTGLMLNGSAECITFDAGEVLFRQSGICRGIYLVLSGQLLRRAMRLETPLTLGPARAGDLVELAAALGDGHHTYSLAAQTAGSALMLPIETINLAFQSYPPLRMQLLEELAREVSRAYAACCLSRAVKPQRGVSAA